MKNKHKRPKRRRKSVRGVPFADLDIQLEWLLKNIDRAKGRGARLGHIARDQFTSLFDDCVVRLLQLGLCEHDSQAKQWAGKILKRVYVSLHKHHGKLSKINSAYKEEVSKTGKIRSDMLRPESPVGQILQKELRTVLRCRFKLGLLRDQFEVQPRPSLVSLDTEAVQRRLQDELVLQHLGAGSGALWTPKGVTQIEKRARKTAADPCRIYPDEVREKRGTTWQDLAEHVWKIPKEYWPAPDLFSKADLWKFIWGRLNDKQADILPRLRASGKGRAEAKEKPLCLKHFYKQFHKHWQAVVK